MALSFSFGSNRYNTFPADFDSPFRPEIERRGPSHDAAPRALRAQDLGSCLARRKRGGILGPGSGSLRVRGGGLVELDGCSTSETY